jgi:hypothetical protein
MVSVYQLAFILDSACDYSSTVFVPDPLVSFELVWISHGALVCFHLV